MRVRAPFDPEATCPLYDKTVEEIFENNSGLIAYFDRYVGYSLTGDCSEESLAFCWGDGANGKGTLMNTIGWLLGDYSDDLPFSAFELPSVVSLLDAVRVASDAHPVPVVASFPEFFRASTWAGAVSLLSLGFTVQIGIRLPFWGSPWLAQVMQTEWQKITGGTLLVAPALPEPRAQAEELAACLRAGQGR